MNDDKKKFDFSDVINAPGMKALVEQSLLSQIQKSTVMANRLLQIKVNVCIEVLSFNHGHGDAWQEPGPVHWMPGVFSAREVSEDQEYTACGILATGMVPDRKDPVKIDCPDCASEYAAWKLKSDRDG